MSILKCNNLKAKYLVKCMCAFVFVVLNLFISTFTVLAHVPEEELPTNIISTNVTLHGGWYTLDPYLYQQIENGIGTLTGLDYELLKAISEEVGIKLEYKKIFWEEILGKIKLGKIDFTTGAIYSKEREGYGIFSEPYRFEEDSIFVLQKNAKKLKFTSIADLLKYLKVNHLKLAVVNGYVYADEAINTYLLDPNNQNLIIKTNNDYENLNMLLDEHVVAFLADRIVGSTIIWRSGTIKPIQEIRLNIHRPIHILFSKKTVSPKVVDQFNAAISKLKKTHSYQKVVSLYLYPILLLQTKDASWFLLTEIIGTIAFAISGLILAFRERATLFGALILAVLPSLGGGIMRDVVLGRNPVGVIRTPIYLSCVLLTVLGGFFILKLLTHCRKKYEFSAEIEDGFIKYANYILVITDAIGLAMFTVIGVIVALLMKAEPLWLWGPFFAFLTGAGGGILRDMLSKTRHIAALEGEMYGEIAVVWGLILSLFITSNIQVIQPEYIQAAVVITALGVFCSRLAIYSFKIPNIHFGYRSQKKAPKIQK